MFQLVVPRKLSTTSAMSPSTDIYSNSTASGLIRSIMVCARYIITNIYHENVQFFNAKIGLDIIHPILKSINISCSYPNTSPLPPLPPNHLHSYQYSICGKTRGGQQCIFDYFWLKLWGVNENLGVERHQKGIKPPNSPTNRALTLMLMIPKSS